MNGIGLHCLVLIPLVTVEGAKGILIFLFTTNKTRHV